MLISAFARSSGLSVDTVRFYVRRGLLHPEASNKGGRNPYQLFTDADLETARVIRVGQALGLSLAAIKGIAKRLADSEGELAAMEKIVVEQRERLVARQAELSGLIDYLDAKLAWLRAPEGKPQPTFPDAVEDGNQHIASAL